MSKGIVIWPRQGGSWVAFIRSMFLTLVLAVVTASFAAGKYWRWTIIPLALFAANAYAVWPSVKGLRMRAAWDHGRLTVVDRKGSRVDVAGTDITGVAYSPSGLVIRHRGGEIVLARKAYSERELHKLMKAVPYGQAPRDGPTQ